MVGFWATLSLNMPDFTRYGRSQREQAIGRVIALASTMTVFAAMGVIITSASAVVYGKAMWDPIELVGHFASRLVVGIAMFTVVIATLSVNIAANAVSPANDFANLAPKRISFKMGGIITGVIGVLTMPWKLIADLHSSIFQWLLGYSGGLGSIAGVLVWIIGSFATSDWCSPMFVAKEAPTLTRAESTRPPSSPLCSVVGSRELA